MRTWSIAMTAAAALSSSAALAQKPSQGTASIPDFSGVWAHPSGNSGFEPLSSGPRPVGIPHSSAGGPIRYTLRKRETRKQQEASEHQPDSMIKQHGHCRLK